MRAWFLAAGLLASCSFTLQPAATDAEVGGEPVVEDVDADGVSNVIDNCPAASNADQRDHDGDARGDACDLCPHLSSAGDSDGDGDSIGDDCDPQPQNGSDRVAMWNGFYDQSSISGWSGAASWNWLAGELHQSSSVAGDSMLTAPGTYQRISVATNLEVRGVGPGGAIGFCSGIIQGTQQYCCVMHANGPTVMAISVTPGVGQSPTTPWPGTVMMGDRIQLVQTRAAGNRCDASRGAARASISALGGPATGTFAFYTGSASAAFDYVFMVELGN